MVEREDKSDPKLATPELEYQPRFEFTKSTVARLQELGFSVEQYSQFVDYLDEYLIQAVQTKHLVAVAVIAVPGTEGMAGYIVDKDGYAIDLVTLWSLPRIKCGWESPKLATKINVHCVSWESPGAGTRKISTGLADSASCEEFPTIEVFRSFLEVEKQRIRFTGTLGEKDHCEFWGLVTTKQLRKEMGQ